MVNRVACCSASATPGKQRVRLPGSREGRGNESCRGMRRGATLSLPFMSRCIKSGGNVIAALLSNTMLGSQLAGVGPTPRTFLPCPTQLSKTFRCCCHVAAAPADIAPPAPRATANRGGEAQTSSGAQLDSAVGGSGQVQAARGAIASAEQDRFAQGTGHRAQIRAAVSREEGRERREPARGLHQAGGPQRAADDLVLAGAPLNPRPAL